MYFVDKIFGFVEIVYNCKVILLYLCAKIINNKVNSIFMLVQVKQETNGFDCVVCVETSYYCKFEIHETHSGYIISLKEYEYGTNL